MATPWRISEVNASDYEDFIKQFGNVIEHCSLIAASVWNARPFRDILHIHEELCRFVDQLPQAGQEGILRCHPDLAGRLAASGQLTAESMREQRSAGLDNLSEEEKAELADMNGRYREKFGFPFVVCARHNKKDAILQGMSKRLLNSTEEEVSKGITEVKKICYLRLQDLVENKQLASKC